MYISSPPKDIEQVLREAPSLQGVEARAGDAETIRENCEALSRGKPEVRRHC